MASAGAPIAARYQSIYAAPWRRRVVVDVAYAMEQTAGDLWHHWSKDRAAYWFDPVPAFFYRWRKRLERWSMVQSRWWKP